MEKITYKEFEREINKIGCHSEDGDSFLYVKHGLIIAAIISKETFKSLNLTYSDSLWAMEESERIKVADLCWQLASTPLADREEPKKYYLKVKPRYNHLFSFGEIYLNYQRQNANIFMSDYHENLHWQTQFTEEECEKLGKEYDLTILERVEVKNEELD